LFFALSFAQLFAQNSPEPVYLCGNDVFSHIVQEKYPALHEAFAQTFEQARAAAQAADRSPLTIKVVVHVVWKDAAENLPDSVIENQILVLNEDFNRLNPDTADLRPFFQPVAGSANIRFELAGIVRTQTNKLFALDLLGGSLLSELKSSAQGGSDAWDTERHLNIWVCKIQPTTIFGLPVGQILGFAFPPNGLGNWPADSGAPTKEQDGVVIDYRMMGRNNPNPIANPGGGGGNLIVKGRTPTHEVGHYLGLRHIWGDGGILGPNNCNQSDGVEDTPFANAQSNFDCNKNKNTCSKIETFYNADVPDLVENYMDYSSESCMNMFTKGQVELMRNVLTGPRIGLIESSSAISLGDQSLSWNISPNPSPDGVFWLDIGAMASRDLQLTVFDATGASIHLSQHPLTGDKQRIALDGTRWPDGVYFVQVKTAQFTSARICIKQ
jgi:hypothetical protein